MKQVYSHFAFGSLSLQYILDTDTRIIGLRVIPRSHETEDLLNHRNDLSSQPENHFFGNWGSSPKPGTWSPWSFSAVLIRIGLGASVRD